MTCSSWERASSLPTALVKDYEDGIQRELYKESFTSGGETIHTLSATQKDTRDSSPKPKQPRVDFDDHDASNSG